MASRRTCQKCHVVKQRQPALRRMTRHIDEDFNVSCNYESQHAGHPFVFLPGDRSLQFKWALRTGYPMIIVTEPGEEVIVPMPFGSGTYDELKESSQLFIAGTPNQDPNLWLFPWQLASADARAAETVDEFVKLHRLGNESD